MVNKKLLEDAYSGLGSYYLDFSTQESYNELRTPIIGFCLSHNIELHNLVQLTQKIGEVLLKGLVELISLRTGLGKQVDAQWFEAMEWINQFNIELRKVSSEVREIHAEAYTSVWHQYQVTREVLEDTLLCFQDMVILLNDERFSTPDILKSNPFELPQFIAGSSSFTQDFFKGEKDDASVEQLKRDDTVIELVDEKLISQLIEQDKDLFLPITHESHWVYLTREKGSWTIYDSNQFDAEKPTERQLFIRNNCVAMLAMYDEDFKELSYVSTGKQISYFDCGTHVVNAWRKMVNKDYIELTHRQMLLEAVSKHEAVSKQRVKFRQVVGISGPGSSQQSESKLNKLDKGKEKANSDIRRSRSSEYLVSNRKKTIDNSLEWDSKTPGSSFGNNDVAPDFNESGFPMGFPESISERDKKLNEQIKEIEQALKEIKKKEEYYKEKYELPDRTFDSKEEEQKYIIKYKNAETAAKELHDGIKVELEDYKRSSKDYNNYNFFKEKAVDLIKNHKSELSTHRNRDVTTLGNVVLAAILGLGVIYGAMVGLHYLVSSRRFYFWRTDAEQKVYDLEDAICDAAPAV